MIDWLLLNVQPVVFQLSTRRETTRHVYENEMRNRWKNKATFDLIESWIGTNLVLCSGHNAPSLLRYLRKRSLTWRDSCTLQRRYLIWSTVSLTDWLHSTSFNEWALLPTTLGCTGQLCGFEHPATNHLGTHWAALWVWTPCYQPHWDALGSSVGLNTGNFNQYKGILLQ